MILEKPIMGWNTWNTFGENINEQLILETADKMIELGYKDAGYEYVIIDDCWSEMRRDENGRLVPDKKKFPHGMKYIADYLHERGMKFGMYSDAGFYTCMGYPASFGHELEDAKRFAEWEIDYLKYDFGFFPTSAQAENAYLVMAQALRLSGRDIAFSVATAGKNEPWKWARSRGGHTFRATDDICDSKESYRAILGAQAENMEMSTFDCFSDWDMLTVGMNGCGNVSRGTVDFSEYENQFLAWAFFATPLILGADIRNMDERCRKLLLNKDVIAINQDKECRPAFKIEEYYEKAKVFARLLSNGDMAVLAINFHEETEVQKSIRLKISFDDLGIRTGSGWGFELTNVLTGENLGIFEAGYGVDVKSDRIVLLRARPVRL